MTFTLTKGYPVHPHGEFESTITRIWMEKDCEVEVKGKKKKSDLAMIEYKTEHGKLTQRYFPVMDEDTDLGKVVKAINNDEIPDEINDPEDFFEGKTIGIVVKHNKSSTSGRTFANVAEVYSLNDDGHEEMDQDEPDEEDDDLDLGDELDEASDDNVSDEELDDEFPEDDPVPKRPKPRRSSNWTSNSYDDDTDDFTD